MLYRDKETPLRIIADENISRAVIEQLRANGHDVLSVKESMQGLTDEAILARARTEQRLVLSHDKDFGELAFRFGLSPSCGVILLRLAGDSAEVDNARAISAIQSRDDWTGYFSVISDDAIRMRPLPS
jgi:predicted nuclease of predicted toxin-antitoxin system